MTLSLFPRGFLRLCAALMVSAALAACSSSDHDDDNTGTPDNGGQPGTSTPAKPELRCAP